MYIYDLARHVAAVYDAKQTTTHQRDANIVIHRARPSSEQSHGWEGWRPTTRLRATLDRFVAHVRNWEKRTANTRAPEHPLQVKVQWHPTRKVHMVLLAGVSHLNDMLLAATLQHAVEMPSSTCKVHAGVLCAAVRLLQVVCQQLMTTAKDKRTPVLFAGHSMGGAVACLLAYWFHTIPALKAQFDVQDVVTFGSVPFCDRHSALHMAQTIRPTHVCMQGDPICWSVSPQQYVLPGDVMCISARMRPRVALDYRRAKILGTHGSESLERHEMSYYRHVLLRHAEHQFDRLQFE